MISHASVSSVHQRSAKLLEDESALDERIVGRQPTALLEYLDRSGHIV